MRPRMRSPTTALTTMKKIYYAHCIAIYKTPQEIRDIVTLEKLGFEVENPNRPEHDAGYRAQGMDYFLRFADECDAIAFRAMPDGAIPAGVAKEISMFVQLGKPVFELPSCITRRTLGVESTREALRECGNR